MFLKVYELINEFLTFYLISKNLNYKIYLIIINEKFC